MPNNTNNKEHIMTHNHTTRELATDRNLWEEYIDPDNNAPTAFDDLTTEEKMEAIVEMFPGDVAEDDDEGQAILSRQ